MIPPKIDDREPETPLEADGFGGSAHEKVNILSVLRLAEELGKLVGRYLAAKACSPMNRMKRREDYDNLSSRLD
jgi:hypothetical protein